MLPVVAAKTSIEIKMPYVVGMGSPVKFHLRERCASVDSLYFSNGGANLKFLFFCKLRILPFVKLVHALCDSRGSFVSRRVFSRQSCYSLGLDEWQCSVYAVRKQ